MLSDPTDGRKRPKKARCSSGVHCIMDQSTLLDLIVIVSTDIGKLITGYLLNR